MAGCAEAEAAVSGVIGENTVTTTTVAVSWCRLVSVAVGWCRLASVSRPCSFISSSETVFLLVSQRKSVPHQWFLKLRHCSSSRSWWFF